MGSRQHAKTNENVSRGTGTPKKDNLKLCNRNEALWCANQLTGHDLKQCQTEYKEKKQNN